jgi:hypothetical protein
MESGGGMGVRGGGRCVKEMADPERRQLRMLSRPGGVVRRKIPMLLAFDGAMTMATASGKDDCGREVRWLRKGGGMGKGAGRVVVESCWMDLVREVHVHVDGGEEGVLSGMRMYPTNYYEVFRENSIQYVLKGRNVEEEEGGGGRGAEDNVSVVFVQLRVCTVIIDSNLFPASLAIIAENSLEIRKYH